MALDKPETTENSLKLSKFSSSINIIADSERKNMKKTYKITFIVLILLAVIAVISSVSVAFVLTDKMKTTGDALTRLRSLMNGQALNIEPLTAYIVPSDDAHQVSLLCKSES